MDKLDNLERDPELQNNRMRSLSRAVILRSIADFDLVTKHKRCKNAKVNAIKWFDIENEDFLLLCEMAEYDPYIMVGVASDAIKFKEENPDKRFTPTTFGVKFHNSK